MEPKPQEKEHKPMAENIPVMCPPVGDRLSTSDNGGRLPTQDGAPKRRPEDVPTIEMTRAELEEMLRTSGW